MNAPAPRRVLASPEVQQQRLARCASCPQRTEVAAGIALCARCGCVLAAKTRFQQATCPLNHW